MPESEPFSIPFDLSWSEDENGVLIVTGCASVPEEDKERELVTKEAIEEALPDFMKLAILHLDHTERPLGPITEAWFDGDQFMIRSPIKMTPDCKDVRDRIRNGELSQFSIFGRRLQGSPACKVHPDHRNETCQTFKLFLDSVSLCPGGNAINSSSYVEHNGGIVVKSSNSDSALIHETADGIKEKLTMEESGAPETPETSQDVSNEQIYELVQELSGTIESLASRMNEIEVTVGEMLHTEPDDIEKADDEEFEEYDGAEEEEDGPDLLTEIAEGLTMVIRRLNDLEDQVNGGGAVEKAELEDVEEEPEEDEYPDDGYEEEEEDEEIEKCSIKKSSDSDPIQKAYSEIDQLKYQFKSAMAEKDRDITILRKAVLELENKAPRDRKVRTVPVEPEEIKKSSENPAGSGYTEAACMAGQF